MTRSMIARAAPRLGQADRLRALVESLAHNVRAEAGNIRFEAHAEANSGAILMIEEYRDEKSFQAQLDQPHTQQFNAALKDVAEDGASQVTDLTPVAKEKTGAAPIRAIDHVGLTVPDVTAASRFLTDAFGAVTVYEVLPADADPMAGDDPEGQLGLTHGTKVDHMRLMRIGDGPTLELFRMIDGEQRDAARLQDIGLTHFALYFDDIDSAATEFQDAGGTLLEGPHPLAGVENGPSNAGVYGRTPWGMLIELLTYPSGIAYPDDAFTIRWTPRP